MNDIDLKDYPPVPLGQQVSLKKLSNRGTPFRVDPAMTKLGNYTESLLYKLLSKYLLPRDNRISIDNLQGGQDFVISVDGKKVYYIEAKSIWHQVNIVEMTSYQFDKAESRSSQYALCVINMIGVSPSVVDTEKDSEINMEDLTLFYPNIGLYPRLNENNGRVTIELNKLENGLSINEFCEYILNVIHKYWI
mgnify:FL=1